MSYAEPVRHNNTVSVKVGKFVIAASLAILFISSALIFFILLCAVPKFAQIYQDALPGKPLPVITEFIITTRLALAMIGLGWPILGVVSVKKKKSYAMLLINIGILEIGGTCIALLIPMIGTN